MNKSVNEFSTKNESTPSNFQKRQYTLPFSERRLLLFTVDVLLINTAVFIALFLWCRISAHADIPAFFRSRWYWFPVLSLAWVLVGWVLDLYQIPLASRRLVALRQVWIAITVMTAGYLLFYFFLAAGALPRLVFIFFALAALVLLSLWRTAYASLFTLEMVKRRVLVVGAGWAGLACAELLSKHAASLYTPVGFVDDDPQKHNMDVAGLPVLGDRSDLIDLVQQYHVNKIVVAITDRMHGDLFRAIVECRALGCTVVRFPVFYATFTNQVPVEHINMDWVLDAMDDFNNPFPYEELLRRLLDLVCASLGLIVLGVILPFVALAVTLEDHGPLFYKQIRSGKAGKPFQVIKFRTMRVDAEKDGVPQWAKKKDARITRVGKFLRKTRLDELPQVVNILRGDMHIVGPRPERPEFIAELEKQVPFYRTRLIVKPGLTGWAQVYYEYGNSVRDALVKLQYDLYYIRHKSIWMDLYIILRTITVVLRMGGM